MEKPIMKEILRKAIETPTFAKEILPMLPLTIFDNVDILKEISQAVTKYYKGSSNMLTEEALVTIVESKLDRMKKAPEVQQEYFNKISELYEIRNSQNNDVIDEEIEKYIKKHLYIEQIKKATLNINNEAFMSKFDEEIRNITMLDVMGVEDEIINVIDDTEIKRRLLSTLNTNTIPTGFPSIDHLNSGGLAKGELGMILALSGTGKTLVLTNLATNYTKRGYNVLFIALEELQNRMVLKFEQAMLRQARSTIISGGNLNTAQFDTNQAVYKKYREKFGNLYFARYSPRTVTPAKIEQLISDVKLRKGQQVDVVIIDYPDLLRNPNATGNESEDGGKLAEEMRRIGQDYNVVMWTASQLNRSAYSARIKTAEHMEGSLRKKNAAELILVVNQWKEEYEAGFLRLYADKVRNPPEGQYEKMIPFKVHGEMQSVLECTEADKVVHAEILKEVEENADGLFKNKKSQQSNKVPTPNFAEEINNAIRGGQ